MGGGGGENGGTLRGEFELCGGIYEFLFYRAKLLNKVSVLLKTTPITVILLMKFVNLTPAKTFKNRLLSI